MDDLEDDFIPLAPPSKRLKRLSTAPPKKATPRPKTTTSKRVTKPELVDLLDLDSSDSPRSAETAKPQVSLEFLNFLQSPAPAAAKQVERGSDSEGEEDWDEVEFGDANEDEGEEKDGKIPQDAESELEAAPIMPIEVSVAVPKEKKDEKDKKEVKKKRRTSEEPRKRRGSAQERQFALRWHNAELLSWIGHALYSRAEIESNRWHQAIMVSFLPFSLFQELSTCALSSSIEEIAKNDWKIPITKLLLWFNEFFEVAEPLEAPKRKIHSIPTGRGHSEPRMISPDLKGTLETFAGGNSSSSRVTIRKFEPFLFAFQTRPRVTQLVAFRAFATILQAVGLHFRMIWYLDLLLAPHKFGDFETVIPPNIRYSPKFCSEYAKQVFKRLNTNIKAIKDDNSDDKSEEKIEKKGKTENAPFVWFEIYSKKEDRYITVDLFRMIIDEPDQWDKTVEIESLNFSARNRPIDLSSSSISPPSSPKPKLKKTKSNTSRSKSPGANAAKKKFGETDCAYLIGVGEGGVLSHVSAKYVNSYTEPLAKMGDWQWMKELLSSWNETIWLNLTKIYENKDESTETGDEINTESNEMRGESISESKKISPENKSIPSNEKTVSSRSKTNQKVSEMKRMEEVDSLEIQRIAESEPLPKTIQAYKNHPIYVLERDLLSFEVLRPDHEPAIHNFGDHKVYLRSQVSVIHTADKWIQHGFQVKEGESPVSSKIKRTGVNWDQAAKTWVPEEEAEMSDYFGDWQILPYEPPVARNGLVPKNKYGNVYLFLPRMMPVGCCRLLGYPGIEKTAKKSGIDFAPAMTGWIVESYWSLPKLEGIIVCNENREALLEAWVEDSLSRENEARRKRRAQIIGNWISITKQVILQERLDNLPKEVHSKGTKDAEDENENFGNGDFDDTDDLIEMPHLGKALSSSKKSSNQGKSSTTSLTGKKTASETKQHVHHFVSTVDGQARKCQCGYVEEVANRL